MKGQTFMPDFLGSLLVFGVLLTMFLSSWNTITSNQQVFGPERQLRLQATHTTTFMVATQGYPEDWHKTGDPDIVGFAEPDHVVQIAKLDAFGDMSYGEQRILLQTQNFNLTFKNQTGIIGSDSGKLTFGRSYQSAENVVPVTRNVELNLSDSVQTAELVYVVWPSE